MPCTKAVHRFGCLHQIRKERFEQSVRNVVRGRFYGRLHTWRTEQPDNLLLLGENGPNCKSHDSRDKLSYDAATVVGRRWGSHEAAEKVV